MKFRLVLVVLPLLPLLSWGQTDKNVIFYSKAPMYVKYKDGQTSGGTESTTLYIGGSIKVASGASIVQKGRTEITEDFYNAMDPVDGKNTLFTGSDPAVQDDGVVAFVGVKTADGTNRQQIQKIARSVDVSDYAQKKMDYISFPTLRVEKTRRSADATEGIVDLALNPYDFGSLQIDTTMAMSIDYLKVDPNNRLALDAGYDKNYVGQQPRLNSAQVLIKKAHSAMVADNINYATYSQLNLAMHNVADETSSTYPNTLRKSANVNYLTGFTPPFKELGADYMLYHVLAKPDGTSVHSNKGPIMNPLTLLKAGQGYFTSMEVTDQDYNEIDGQWLVGGSPSVYRTTRAKGKYVFSRKLYEDFITKNGDTRNPSGGVAMTGFSRFAYDPAKAIAATPQPNGNPDKSAHPLLQTERFSVGQVLVSLQTGANFLGNPFMAPISLNNLLGWAHDYVDSSYAGVSDSEAEAPFNVALLTPQGAPAIKASSFESDPTKVDLRSKFWLINNATIQYIDDKFLYKVTYDYVSREAATVGLTSNLVSPESYLIAPMQMFVLQASKPVQIALDPGLCTFGPTNFKKSASVQHKDWFVVEMENTADGSKDRTAITFNEKARIDTGNGSKSDAYDTSKGVVGGLIDEYNKATKFSKSVKDLSGVDVIYTKAADGTNMLGNAIPLDVKELSLYATPPAKQQLMKLNFYGLENLESVNGVWLVDRYENNKTIKIEAGDVYEYTSGPSDLKEFAEENRFILKFYQDQELTSENTAPITCYYNRSTLNLSNLNESDINSKVQVYDIQGRLMAETKVTEYPTMSYLKPLSIGTYIVKITGARNYSAKFVNLQD